MKVFNLCCEFNHAFEGWFGSAEDFETQNQSQLVRCPVCDSAAVRKMPAAPHLNFNVPAPRTKDSGEAMAAGRAQVMETLRKLIVESEDVGERFADEARKIHSDPDDLRSIRGVTTPEERSALEDEGIAVLTLPWPVPQKETLQ